MTDFSFYAPGNLHMVYDSTHKKTPFKGREHCWICFLLIALTLAVYGPVKDFEFVNFDDPQFVLDSHFIQKGLTLETLVLSFTDSIHMTNYWVPLTCLSIIFDFQVYGLNAGGYHVTNLILHLLNTVLLFMVLNRMTGALWQSAFVAALFALHPLHVESVAWVTERKDVLSTFFGMLALYSYAWYVERPGFRRYVWVIIFFIFGLMSKPMLVTLPFVLLLLDYWPLGRHRSGPPAAISGEPRQSATVLRLVWEKVPFFMVTLAACVAAYVTQDAADAIAPLSLYPLSVRFVVTLVSYVSYIGKMCWPYPLAVLYPHPGTLPLWQGAGAGLLLLLITFLALKSARRYPWFIIGWLWYLGTLLPVSGLVVIGPHAMADRYTYIPLIGLFIIIAWGASDLFRRWSSRPLGIAAAAIGVLLILMVLTGFQVRYWENSVTLFEHANEVVHDDFIIHSNLGNALARKGRLNDAVAHYSKALAINPGKSADIHNNLGAALLVSGKTSEAMTHFRLALQIEPGHVDALRNIKRISSQKENVKHTFGSP